MNAVHYSTGKDDWETPLEFYGKLNKEFNFTLDACASDKNAKCSRYYTIEQDGLAQDWSGETVYCNPPYSRKGEDGRGQAAWIKKCHDESQKPGTTVVALLPARTDTKAFHSYIYGVAEIRFIKGRIKFSGSKDSAPFPSMVAVWR